MLFSLEGGRTYDRYYDVVVLGDSFSNATPLAQWQNYLVRETGLSLVTYKVDDIDIDSFVSSSAYKDHPPRVVIYQTIERSFVGRGTGWNKGDCKTVSVAYQGVPARTLSGTQTTRPHMRNTRNGPLHPNLSSGAHYLKRVIKKTFNKKSNRAIKLPLSRNDLFSNRQSGHLLVYRNDFERYQVSKGHLNQAICGLSYIQNTFQKNGETLFVGMIAPDKLTAYQNLIKDFDREKINWMKEIQKHRKLNVPNLKVSLKNEIARGALDVYLPNDTHWGSAGHRTVARALQEYLKRRGVIAPLPASYDR